MKRIHYLLLGLLVSLTIAAVSPSLPPTRIISGGSSVTVVTNGVNNFTLTASGGVGTSNGLATNLSVYSSGTTNRALRVYSTNGEAVWVDKDGVLNATNTSNSIAGYLPLAGGTMTGPITGGNGTLVASAPMLNLAQTWNNAAVDFTALNLNVTNTASLGESAYVPGSSLFKLMVGAVNKFRVDRDGGVWIGSGGDYTTVKFSKPSSGATFINLAPRGGGAGPLVIDGGLDAPNGVFLDPQAGYIGFGQGSYFGNNPTSDTRLYKDAAGTLAQRNGVNAQTSRVYGTYTDASNYVRASLSSSATEVTLAAQTAGTGADNLDVNLITAGTGKVVLNDNGLVMGKTITAPATTGNQTINKAAGRVNIAAAGTTVVVTCSLVTANSIIIAVAATDDATAMVTSVVPAAGSFTINTVATTAETAFNFLIVN